MRNHKRVLLIMAAVIVVLAAVQGLAAGTSGAQPASTSSDQMAQARDAMPPICYSRMDYYYACRNGWKPKL